MISIEIEACDNDNKVMFIRNGKKNIWGLVSLMQFEDEMDYYGISLVRKRINGEIGYVFSNNIDEELVCEETKRFLKTYNMENMNTL